jgi:arylsulfatase A-like enzyme
LIVKFPFNRTAGLRVPGKAMILDVAPTVLAAVGAPTDGMDGKDLALFLDGKNEPHPATFAETGRNFYPENPRRPVRGLAGNWKSIRTGRWKLILIPAPNGPTYELYDVGADPAETRDLWTERRKEADSLAEQLDEWLASFAPRRGAKRSDAAEAPIDDAAAERLRALGYMNQE